MVRSATAAQLVAASARNLDPDRYMAALLAPRSLREDLITLAALTGEIRRISRTVREPMLAAIRLQWWRDALEFGATTGYPVADDAIHLVRRLAVTREVLQELTRTSADLDAPPTVAPDDDGWRAAGAADAAAFRIAATIVGVAASPGLDRATVLAGEAFGVARRLNAEAGGDVASGASRLALPLEPWIDGVRTRREEIRRQLAETSAGLLVALLPLALIEPYLQSLQEHEGGGARASSGLAPLTRAWCLWRAKLRQRI